MFIYILNYLKYIKSNNRKRNKNFFTMVIKKHQGYVYNMIKKLILKHLRKHINALYEAESKKFKTPYIKRKVIEGISFDFYIGDQDGKDWYDTYCTDPYWTEMRIIRDYLIAPGDVVLECGGHQGCTAILLSNWVGPTGKVITFEPNPNNVEILKINLEINNIKNVSIEPKAVGNENGIIKLSTETSNSFINTDCIKNYIQVPIVELDNYAHYKPTFIKLDVEGADIQALRGAKNILKTLPKIAIEVHTDSLSRFNDKLEDFFCLIDFSKYDAYVQWNYEKEIKPWDFYSPDNQILGLEKFVQGTHIFLKPKK